MAQAQDKAPARTPDRRDKNGHLMGSARGVPHLSSGGGAVLFEGRSLPSVQALDRGHVESVGGRREAFCHETGTETP